MYRVNEFGVFSEVMIEFVTFLFRNVTFVNTQCDIYSALLVAGSVHNSVMINSILVM